ncbi:MAG: AraC family transcriptional regulator [Hoeflea sp.]|nr:AraC family transcriptional regulator [Hoeflea sp.]MBU4528180.1 AraC family transcriptional regulator [Alphaproteobacteria bacterium]MBU4543776.1 AraC family transcriptional regulator [Alphaproteobacteria bacterium]MBU4548643.1 AraC family transcriptional regulator [Alphaproteobacteria bacterium]MBV1725809.1 AraC family transcriptional regulator [Hoeflea sp.]MBV1762165.1 AraC family transcriptional regulator [Hoeflea sp.]
MSFELTLAGFIDLILRGGTFGILLLVIVHLVRRPEFNLLCGTGFLFCVTGLVEIILNSPPVVAMLAPADAITLATEQFHFIAMWWFVLALFDDRFSWRLRHFWPVAVAIPLVAGGSLFPEAWRWWFNIALVLLNATLLAMIIHRALRHRSSDLVNERRSFSLALAFSVPPFTLFVFFTNLMGNGGPLNDLLCAIYAAVYFVLALGFSYWLTTLTEELFQRSGDVSVPTVARGGLSAADRLELDRVVKAVEAGLYLEPGLTIGGLAAALHIPEHRLRRLINSGLGHRNFAAFVNDYRIDEAKRRLSNPEMAREQIIQHAFSLGYASLAPFNRAFRERVGVSPTEFREEALTRMAAE